MRGTASWLVADRQPSCDKCGKMMTTYKILTFFFFQAEDGIRDTSVTGVQTCALPIFLATVPFLETGLFGSLGTVAKSPTSEPAAETLP